MLNEVGFKTTYCSSIYVNLYSGKGKTIGTKDRSAVGGTREFWVVDRTVLLDYIVTKFL